MRYLVLATDYDGTLAHHGKVTDSTVAALDKLLETGRRLVLVTGRELPELLGIFPQIDRFEWVVAENGALLYKPSTKEERPIADPPPPAFLDALKARKVGPVSVGRSIVATWEPHQNAVLDAIKELGLELQVIFNKGAVMILPAGVNKAFGLTAALREMGMSPHNAVGVGDAENDHAMLRLCEFSAAVCNALPAVMETADLVTKGDHGAGVEELIAAMVGSDLSEHEGKLTRHHVALGKSGDDEVKVPPYGPGVLICGPSASGKSTVATGLLEAIADRTYQFCLIDPEGDYETFEGAVVLGGPGRAVKADEVMQLLEKPEQNVVVSLTGLKIPDRPPLFLELLPRLMEMRGRTGRPHWLILDEAHHLMPAEWEPPTGMLPDEMRNTLLITVHPDLLSRAVLGRIGTMVAVGQDADKTLKQFADGAGIKPPGGKLPDLQTGEFLMWHPGSKAKPVHGVATPPRSERRRHRRKYAEGELPPDRSFFFRGPESKLNLRAQNLMVFLQIGDGVDDATWDFHLKAGDYSKWFRERIKDELLAEAAEEVEESGGDAKDTRAAIRAAVEKDYTLPGSPPLPVKGAS